VSWEAFAEKPAEPVDSGERFPDIYSGSRTMSDSPDDAHTHLLQRALAGDE